MSLFEMEKVITKPITDERWFSISNNIIIAQETLEPSRNLALITKSKSTH